MPLSAPRSADQYPPWIGLIFVFNLIVGTGALTLPAVIAKAGWLLGTVFIVLLAFISYMTVTFVIETMACANAVNHWRRLQFLKRDSVPSARRHYRHIEPSTSAAAGAAPAAAAAGSGSGGGSSGYADETGSSDDDELPIAPSAPLMSSDNLEHTPLFSQTSRYYVLDNKMEMGEMAGLFFNDVGRLLFYLCLAIYLYGDLSIYSAVVAKTLRDVMCTKNTTITNATDDQLELEPCWPDHSITRIDCYRLALIAFVMILGPFTFFNVQKTKYIQMCTVLFRWLAFTIMISIAVHRLLVQGAAGTPPLADLKGVPSLFGACIYSFMCHHSLPSLIFPISDKSRLRSLLSLDYVTIAVFYLCLALTGAFAFANLEDVYTLNFVPSADNASALLRYVEYFLSLFPVFTLSASFPIIAITLRNNLQTLFLDTARLDSYHFVLRSVLFPLLTIVPPALVTYYTDNVKSLVSFTGSYAGTGIQYIIPIALVYSARRSCRQLLGQGIVNDYRSPFRHSAWLVAVLVWGVACVVLVTVNFCVHVSDGD